LNQTVGLLRSLGHEVNEYRLAHPVLLVTFTPRWAAGIADEADGHTDGLERRTRQMVWLGHRLHGRAPRRSIARERVVAQRLNTVFERHDLVLTPTTAAPPPPANVHKGAGAVRAFNQGSPYHCYTPTWNYVGQPAAWIPAGFDSDGVPMAIQLAGPRHSEATILSLAAQIDSARPWAQRRPAHTTIGRGATQ
jgi:amidase